MSLRFPEMRLSKRPRIRARSSLGCIALLLVVIVLQPGRAQQSNQAFKRALPGYVFRFPADHAAHPDFRTEWWYYNGHLLAEGGGSFGFQVTFFRHALQRPSLDRKSPWALHTVYFAHFALTDPGNTSFRFREKVSRGAFDMAGADPEAYHVWVEDWEVRLHDGVHRVRAGERDMALDLALVPIKPPVVHGSKGVSQKAVGEGYASHYYSLTRLKATGSLCREGRCRRVTGQAWMDHEFGSNQLRKYQVGWDWFSVQLENQTELMLYLIRHRNGCIDPASSGTLVHADGRWEHLTLASFQVEKLGTWHSDRTGATYPSGWLVRLPGQGLKLRLEPTLEDQELDTRRSILVNYWEGSVGVSGTLEDNPVHGRGYVELTGYNEAFRPDI